jgi:signal transduction histidine kinase
VTRERSTITTAGDASLRSWSSVAASLALAATLSLLPLLEPVHRLLGVDAIDVAMSMSVFAATMISGAILYQRLPPGSHAFSVFDRVETALIEIAVFMLVYASGRGDSFFWLLVLVHIMMTGNYASHPRYHLALFATLPVVLAAAFVIGRGDIGAAALSLVIGALGVYVYWIALGVGRKLVAAEAARVHADRQRIARDIHDGIGADLAALDWRLRALHAEPDTPPALRTEVDALAGRLAQSADDLRAIVWALRTPERRWADLVSYVRQRARELAGESITVTVDDGGDGGVAARPGELALDYLRSVLELVRNAVRHAAPTSIAISMRSSPTELGATVVDDGRGIPVDVLERSEGGLANLRHRTAQRGGALVVSASGGTRIDVTFAT